MLGRAFGLLTLALAVGCAEGSTIGEGGGEEGGGTVSGGGDGGTGHGTVTVTNNTTTNGPGPGGSNEGGSGEGGMPPAGGSGEGGSSGVCNYTAPEVCTGAEPLPSVSGDEGNDIVTRTGDTSRFFKVQITEDDSGIGDADMSYTVTLTSPPGMNYDLRIRQGAQEGNVDCNATLKTGAGTPETVSDGWDDDQGFGGEDDSVWLVVEVVYVSGDLCGSSNMWSLQVRGNT